MFLSQAFRHQNELWKYAIGFIIIMVAYFIGQLPLTAAVLLKVFLEDAPMPTTNDEVFGFFTPNLTFFLMLLIFVFALAALYLVVKKLHKQPFLEVTTARKKVDWNRIFFSFSLWGAFTVITTVVAYYLNPGDYIVNFKLGPFLILSVIAILLIPIQTSFEEYLFRGYLMQGFGMMARNKWVPLVLTSVIFGSMHLLNPEVEKMGYIILVYYIGTGFLLGILTLMDEGMELSLGFHAANNLFGALLVTADWTVFKTDSILRDIAEPTAGFDVLLPVCIVYPILLIIFSKKYNWTGWKEKLTGKLYPELKTENNEIAN